MAHERLLGETATKLLEEAAKGGMELLNYKAQAIAATNLIKQL